MIYILLLSFTVLINSFTFADDSPLYGGDLVSYDCGRSINEDGYVVGIEVVLSKDDFANWNINVGAKWRALEKNKTIFYSKKTDEFIVRLSSMQPIADQEVLERHFSNIYHSKDETCTAKIYAVGGIVGYRLVKKLKCSCSAS